ncbi:MAG: CoA pyrophosphatase [Actinomycetota bacterium]|nr:CoA pyrophosphatase [Actinomycetota bacterium]
MVTADAVARVPSFMLDLAAKLGGDLVREHMARWTPPEEGGRASAVLILIADDGQSPDVLLIERAAMLRNHAGQPAFPGGGADPGDADPAATALREAAEEVALDPAGVSVLGTLPSLFLEPSGYVVTPVLAYWHTPGPVRVLDPAEVASVHRIPFAELAEPANRFSVSHPSGYTGAAFGVRGKVVWGFTAGVLSMMLELAGWRQPWDETDVRDLDAAILPQEEPA